MDRKTILKTINQRTDLNRPARSRRPESALQRGHLPIGGTNVVRSPLLGIHRPGGLITGPLFDPCSPSNPPHQRCLISIWQRNIVVCSDSFQSSKAFTSAREQDGVRNGSSRIGLRSGLTSQP